MNRVAQTLSILIPVFNERTTIGPLLERVRSVELPGIEKQIIVIDDASTDDIGEVLSGCADCVFLRHEKNQGKGAAIRTGLRAATGDWVLIQDADLEYDPGDYRALLQMVRAGAPVVYGSRLLGRRWRDVKKSGITFFFGGLLVTCVTNMVYHSRLTDVSTGYKLFSRRVLANMPLACNRFDFCTEVTAKLLRRGIPIVEVPIGYSPRTVSEGKKIRWRDGVKNILTLWKYRAW